MFVFFILNFHLEALGYSRDTIGLAQAVISEVGVVLFLPTVSYRDEVPRGFRVEHPASWMALRSPQILVGLRAGLVILFLKFCPVRLYVYIRKGGVGS